jgi:cyclophilin family peptidyl-prolyl cis-trans isomerase/protein-disulfide isomerase
MRRIVARSILLIGALAACAPAPPPSATPVPPARTPILLGPTSTIPPRPSPAPIATGTPTPIPIPTVSAEEWSLGPAGAPIEFLVYSDFQSPNAAFGLLSLLTAYDRHPGDLRIVFRQFPVLPEYDKDSLAGQAAEAAGRQGLFWPMVRLLAEQYQDWSVLPPDGFTEWLNERVPSLGVDLESFQQDMSTGRYAALMVSDFQEASALGVPGVPTIFMNGVPLRFSPTPLQVESAVRLELLASETFAEPPDPVIDPSAGYSAVLVLPKGDVVLQLFPASAPEAVNSFVFLARQGWFDGMPIYAVTPGVEVESGDPSGTGLGDPGYHLPDEIDPNLDFESAGMVALVSAGPGTGGSRFFITLEPLPSLNGSRTIFGRVVEGLEILQSLEARDPAVDLLTPGAVKIRQVRVETSG